MPVSPSKLVKMQWYTNIWQVSVEVRNSFGLFVGESKLKWIEYEGLFFSVPGILPAGGVGLLHQQVKHNRWHSQSISHCFQFMLFA
jgi:hypothetical protein